MDRAIQTSKDGGRQDLAGKYLTFNIRNESYGIDVLQVREIIRMTSITAVPDMPGYVLGVINLRGKIIPVMDLRLRFGMGEANNTEQSCIVVVELSLPGRLPSQIGLLVEGVEEVVNVASADIEDPPDFGAGEVRGHVSGMAKLKGKVKILLNIQKVLPDVTSGSPAAN
jgi:purine-binding chemotaxis protein CheW